MKKILLILLTVISCKNEKKSPEVHLSAAERIAQAHGIDNWHNVSEIRFTFSVDRDSIKGAGRSWTWLPQKDSVMLSLPDQTVAYSRRHIDSIAMRADRAFINDKFWLLIPFQLVWDSGATITEATPEAAPISGTVFNKLTLTYPSDGGGYTPGDAYDIYYNDQFLIQEWVFRKGNAPEPTLATTFEDYQNFNGLQLALSHKRSEENWNLRFSNVAVSIN